MLLAVLTACGTTTYNGYEFEDNTPTPNEVYEPTVIDELETQSNATIYIAGFNKEHLNSFGNFYEFDFLAAHAEHNSLEDDHWFFTLEGEWGPVIWADIPLGNLQVITLGHYDTEYGSFVYQDHVLYELGDLPQNTPFFISRLVTVGGVLPWEGISFTDQNGVRRYFSVVTNNQDAPGSPEYFLLEFEDGGELWGLATSHMSVNVGFGTYGSRVNINETTRRNIVTANQSIDTLSWVVEPTLPHQSITLCNCGAFVDDNWNVIDINTGLFSGEPHLGHGGASPHFVYDPALDLFGHSGYGFGYHDMIGMHPFSEIATVFPLEHYRRLFAVELVDSTRRSYWDWQEGAWDLDPDARLGLFALMYNQEFTTVFAFNEVRIARVNDNFTTLPFAAVRIGDLWGAIDIAGNVVIPYMFEDLTFIDAGRAFAKVNGAYGILDVSGNIR